MINEEWLKREFNEYVFDNIQTLFPEHQFTRTGKGWYSPLKLDKSRPKRPRKDKTIISNNYITIALEQGGEAVTLINLFGFENGLTNFREIIYEMCNRLGILAQEDTHTDNTFSSDYYQKKKEKESTAVKVFDQCKFNLLQSQGKEVYQYLVKSRNYSKDYIENQNFGAVTQRELQDLLSLCEKPEAYKDLLQYPFIIPYYSRGSIKGFIFRRIDAKQPKYKNLFFEGTKKNYFFGLPYKATTKQIVIVEGELDALTANNKVDDFYFIAASGGELSAEKVADLKKNNCNSAIILFDKDDTQEGRENAHKRILRAITYLQEANIKPLIATFPQEDISIKVDVESFLKSHTGGELERILNYSVPPTEYNINRLVSHYSSKEITPLVYNSIKAEATKILSEPYATSTERAEGARLFCSFINLNTSYQIDPTILLDEATQETNRITKDAYKNNIIASAKKALLLAQEGNIEEASKVLQLAKEDNIDTIREFQELAECQTIENYRENQRRTPEGIKTGYKFSAHNSAEREELLLVRGGLTLICAPTSHGKSRFLENLSYNVATNGSEGDTLYFTFEEDREAVQRQFVNLGVNEFLSYNNLRTLNSYYRGAINYFSSHGENIEEFERKEKEVVRLFTSGKLRIYYEDFDAVKLAEYIRYYSREHHIKAVFIDYIQLLTIEGCTKIRKDELKDICRLFMKLAIELSIPIVFAAQLNREAYSPLDMACQNIAEASDIEHAANSVILLWNSLVKPTSKSAFYDKENKPVTEFGKELASNGFILGNAGKIYATLAKNRGGRRNLYSILDFNGNTGKITQQDDRQKDKQPKLL